MRKNIKSTDRILRIAAAGVLIVLVLANQVAWAPALVMAVAAIVLLATGLFGFCPIYALFGINKEVPDETAK